MTIVIPVICFSRNSFLQDKIYEMDDALLVRLGTARPYRDQEDVGFRQLSWMEKAIESFDGQGQKFISVMLHYLIGIPDTGIDKIINAGYR